MDEDRWGRVDFVIRSSDQTPEELAEAVGLTPERSWRKNEPRKHTGRPNEASGVVFSSGLSEDAHPYEQLESLIHRLDPQRERIAALAEQLNAESGLAGKPVCLHFAHTPTGAMPGYFFSTAVIGFLSDVGASLAVSLYIIEDAIDRD